MTIQTSTVFDAIDYLVTLVRALPECAAPVEVHDGFPGSSNADTIVTIGGTAAPTSDGSTDWASLGGTNHLAARDERYTILCVISAYAGGDADSTAGPTDAADAQAIARAQARTIEAAIETAVRNDPTFGGLFGTGWASILDTWSLDQTGPDNDTGIGRMCELTFHVGVFSRRYTS